MAAPWLAYFATWRWPWLPVRWAAAAGVATGLASFIVPYLTWANASQGADLPIPSLPSLPALPPGTWLIDAYDGYWPPTLAILVMGVAAAALVAWIAPAFYPAMWEATTLTYARPSARQRRRGVDAGYRRSASSAHIPPGVAALLWREWIAERRRPGYVLRLFGLFTAAVLGGLFLLTAFYARDVQTRNSAGALALLGVGAILWWALTRSVNVRDSLRSPLWWAAPARATMRLLMWSAATAAPYVGALWIFVFISNSALQLWFTGLLVVLSVATVWNLRSSALLAAVMLPTSMDERGPAPLLRIGLGIVSLTVAGVMAFLALVVTRVWWAFDAGIVASVFCVGLLQLVWAGRLVQRAGVSVLRSTGVGS